MDTMATEITNAKLLSKLIKIPLDFKYFQQEDHFYCFNCGKNLRVAAAFSFDTVSFKLPNKLLLTLWSKMAVTDSLVSFSTFCYYEKVTVT